MNHPLQMTERRHLEQIAADSTAPKPLRNELKQRLATLDAVTRLSEQATVEQREAATRERAHRKDSPSLILDALDEGLKVSTGDLLPDYLDILNRHILTDHRQAVARNAVNAAWQRVHSTLGRHAVDVLGWIAEVRVGLPFDEALPEHQTYAWKEVSGRFQFRLPPVSAEHRFRTLNVNATSEAMRRTWRAVAARETHPVADNPLMRQVVGFWPDLEDAEAVR